MSTTDIGDAHGCMGGYSTPLNAFIVTKNLMIIIKRFNNRGSLKGSCEDDKERIVGNVPPFISMTAYFCPYIVSTKFKMHRSLRYDPF